jgi:hypothetical protein
MNNDGDYIRIDGSNVEYTSCQCCGGHFLTDTDGDYVEMHDTQSGMVCPSCFDDDYVNCENCDEYVHNDNAEYDDDTCEYTCSHCQRQRPKVIAQYHDRNNEATRAVWNSAIYRRNLFFGVELELKAKPNSNNLQVISDAAKAHGFLAERDGSLDHQWGVEIVGPPMSMQENADRWQSFLKAIEGHAVAWMAGTNYGMHVSFSRRTLSNLHAGKLLAFVHRHKSLCESIAGRSANEWCRFVSKKISYGADPSEDSGEKYEALAIRRNSRWEMRIFRSTLLFGGFMRNLQFTQACIDFNESASARATDTDFKRWVLQPDQRSQYPDLFNAMFPSYEQASVKRLEKYALELARRAANNQ